MDLPAFNEALAAIWDLVRAVNRYVDVSAPWSLAKDPGAAAELDTVLYHSLEGLRVIALLISPFMPGAAQAIWERLGLSGSLAGARLPDSASWGLLEAGLSTTRGKALFPRKLEPVTEGS